MKKMQRGYLKFLAGFIILSASLPHSFAQTSSFRLKTADSLFQAKQYTQSFEHYEEILKQKQYTPAMLLKMAYIQEGLGHTGQSLYYLNLYYTASHDNSALEKMTELATKYNLEGYETSDTDNFLSFYHDYHVHISMALAAIMILMLSLSAYTRLRLKRRPIASFSILSILVIVLAGHLYFGQSLETAIVTNPSTYVMSGPSAASSVLEVIGDGHRVSILGQKDVWLKVSWDGNIGYIKENSLLPVKL
ncbi:SH3 domain-containing protein [Fulvivirgaceae bacterium PWU4]|uniref:SH3 domain-containing protein n=1 Tax=Chryseosolibacter histidini TaxID=2782349 RepID=A0AAP2GHJ0_9BACT|nr:SH3 domain-containing protein [Chryseosolibacter histidini]MBT1696081.1 SH3 domain-containing protein [Chryseosolibacter histidini]